jgi:hypothetical protein
MLQRKRIKKYCQELLDWAKETILAEPASHEWQGKENRTPNSAVSAIHRTPTLACFPCFDYC